MEKKIGVYICSGCDIDKAVDTAELEKVATREYKAPVCKTHPFLCSREGIQLMKEDQKNEGVNSFVVAACSPRYHESTFDMGAETIMVRVPLREQVAWVLEPRNAEGEVNEDTQMAGEDYMRMYVSKMKQHQLPVAYEQETDKSLLVIKGRLEIGKSAFLKNIWSMSPPKRKQPSGVKT